MLRQDLIDKLQDLVDAEAKYDWVKAKNGHAFQRAVRVIEYLIQDLKAGEEVK
jgi:hypothetical protein